jgi:hypothetical protein
MVGRRRTGRPEQYVSPWSTGGGHEAGTLRTDQQEKAVPTEASEGNSIADMLRKAEDEDDPKADETDNEEPTEDDQHQGPR